MAIADRSGLPVAIGIASASPHEVTLVEETIDHAFLAAAPERLIGDRAYDSDGLDERLWEERGIELIARHRSNPQAPEDSGWPPASPDEASLAGRTALRVASELPATRHPPRAPRRELPRLRPPRLRPPRVHLHPAQVFLRCI